MNGQSSGDFIIDVGSLIQLGWAKRYVLLGAGLLGAIAGFALSLILPRSYVVEALVVPADTGSPTALAGIGGALSSLVGMNLPLNGNVSRTAALGLLESRGFCLEFAGRTNLARELFWKKFDAASGTWKIADPDRIPTLDDTCERFRNGVLDVSSDELSGLIHVSVEWKDSKKAALWANDFVKLANDRLRESAIADANGALRALQAELVREPPVEIRAAINRLIEQQLGKMAIAKGTPDYALNVLDPAQAKQPQDYDWPKRRVLAAIGGVVGLFLGMVLAIVLERRTRSRASRRVPVGPAS